MSAAPLSELFLDILEFLDSADMRISEIERRPESGGMKDDVLSTGDRTAAEARSVWELTWEEE